MPITVRWLEAEEASTVTPEARLAKASAFAPMMSVGALGVISVVSNVTPKPVVDMVHAALDDRWPEALALHRKYYRLFTDLFCDTNPIPVKAAMAMMGLCEEVYRLPLCETSEANKAKIRDCLRQLNLV